MAEDKKIQLYRVCPACYGSGQVPDDRFETQSACTRPCGICKPMRVVEVIVFATVDGIAAIESKAFLDYFIDSRNREISDNDGIREIGIKDSSGNLMKYNARTGMFVDSFGHEWEGK